MDQDALNVFFVDNFLKLPVKFDHIFHFMREEKIEREIYHYCGIGMKPHPNFKSKFNRLWFSYFVKTPFFDLDSLGNLWDSFEDAFNKNRKQAVDQISVLQTIFQIYANRDRAFYTYPENVDKIKRFFGDDPNDLFFNASDPSSIDSLIQDIQNFPGKRLYCLYILEPFYTELKQKLFDLGLKWNEDFLNVYWLFKEIPNLVGYTSQISSEI